MVEKTIKFTEEYSKEQHGGVKRSMVRGLSSVLICPQLPAQSVYMWKMSPTEISPYMYLWLGTQVWNSTNILESVYAGTCVQMWLTIHSLWEQGEHFQCNEIYPPVYTKNEKSYISSCSTIMLLLAHSYCGNSSLALIILNTYFPTHF